MEKLNCKSLMIGDWVSYGGTPIKVENVYEDCINFQHDIPFVQEEFLIEQTEIEPIPLTPEILEKNGFSNNGSLWYLEEDNFELEHNNNDSFIWIVGDVYIVALIKYVHQLQHALRLCGIEKEIIL